MRGLMLYELPSNTSTMGYGQSQSKTLWTVPILHSNLLYEMSQDFLDIQYALTVATHGGELSPNKLLLIYTWTTFTIYIR